MVYKSPTQVIFELHSLLVDVKPKFHPFWNQVRLYLIPVLYYIMLCHKTNNAPPPLRIPIHYSFVDVRHALVTRPLKSHIHITYSPVTEITSWLMNNSLLLIFASHFRSKAEQKELFLITAQICLHNKISSSAKKFKKKSRTLVKSMT